MGRTIKSLEAKYDYNTAHYIGPDLKTDPIPKVIKPALNGNTPTIGFKYHPDYNPEGFPLENRGKDFEWSVKLLDNGMVEVTTSQNRFRANPSQMFVDGRISPFYMEDDLHFETWRDGAVQSPEDTYSKPIGKIIHYAEGPERVAELPKDNSPIEKYVADSAFSGDNRLFGKALSLHENVRSAFRKVMFEEPYKTELKDAFSFLKDSYKRDGEDYTSIGIGDTGRALATVDGYGNLTVNKDFYKTIEKEAKAIGLGDKELDYLIMEILTHESGHRFQDISDVPKAEVDLSTRLSNYYSNKAKELAGTQLGKVYSKLAAKEKYLVGLWKDASKEDSHADLESMISELAEEAQEKGYTGNEIAEYVADKLEETARKDSAKEAKNDYKAEEPNSSRKQDAEGACEE